jgi:hypothetical protein
VDIVIFDSVLSSTKEEVQTSLRKMISWLKERRKWRE